MDIASLVGIIGALAYIMVGVGGGIQYMLDPAAGIIVIGGTIAGTLIALPLSEFLRIGPLVWRYIFFPPPQLTAHIIANKSAGADSGNLLSQEELRHYKYDLRLGAFIFGRMQLIATGFGLIGVLIGIVLIAANISDMEALGPAISICVLTILYSAILGTVFFLPFKTKFERYLQLIEPN
jgi:chemotaxis protein MotA